MGYVMRDMESPLVSIGVAVRNGGSLLEDALEQIVSQTQENIEIVISNNNSTDQTDEVVRISIYGEGTVDRLGRTLVECNGLAKRRAGEIVEGTVAIDSSRIPPVDEFHFAVLGREVHREIPAHPDEFRRTTGCRREIAATCEIVPDRQVIVV